MVLVVISVRHVFYNQEFKKIFKKLAGNKYNRQTHRNRKQMSGDQGLGVGDWE